MTAPGRVKGAERLIALSLVSGKLTHQDQPSSQRDSFGTAGLFDNPSALAFIPIFPAVRAALL